MTPTRVLKRMVAEKRIWILIVSFWLLAAHSIAAATKPAVPLRVAYSSISGSAIVPWIAVDKGLFAKYDLDVELVYVAALRRCSPSSAARRRSASKALSPFSESTYTAAIQS